ncbi:MAG: putative quinol monooxygenase [Candidatus Eiseniibacteriota bacterium]
MSKIKAVAKVKIPSGMLGEYQQSVNEYIKQIREKDSGTLQFDWYINSDNTECEIHEVYASSEAAMEHQEHLRELQGAIFKKFGKPYSVTVYGNPSSELLQHAKSGGMDIKVFSLLQGL